MEPITSYTDGVVLLKPLAEADAEFFGALYRELAKSGESPFLAAETNLAFTRRIRAACNGIWTIRRRADPTKIIGDCALHDWNPSTRELEIGGALWPQYQGKGLMQRAFTLLVAAAHQQWKAQAMLGITQATNTPAIRLLQKLGFEVVQCSPQRTVLRRALAPA